MHSETPWKLLLKLSFASATVIVTLIILIIKWIFYAHWKLSPKGQTASKGKKFSEDMYNSDNSGSHSCQVICSTIIGVTQLIENSPPPLSSVSFRQLRKF
jgi:hypothetical protein